MRVKVVRSPNPKKKFRAILEDGRTVDFGASGYSDYTKHENPSRMRAYVRRHGGSGTQNWTLAGIDTPGFWSRWYLWSRPSAEEARRFMSKKFSLTFQGTL